MKIEGRIICCFYNIPFEERELTSYSESYISEYVVGKWLILVQHEKTVTAYTQRARFNFHFQNLITLDPAWSYTSD